MKLDSIDQIYFSRLRPRDKFEARRKLDNIAQLIDKFEDRLKERERALSDRERIVYEKERDIQRHERNHGREHDQNQNSDNDHNYDNEEVQLSPISVTEFNQLNESLEKTPFDQDKRKIIKTSAMNNYFLIDQAIQIVSKFPFDKDKLDIIEVIYPRILDLDRNYLLYNCFTFSDSKDKLEKFIEEYSRRK
jgi:hypothetical protein